MKLKEHIKNSNIKVKSTQCYECKAELDYQSTSVHHNGEGIFYCYCRICNYGRNVSFKLNQDKE